MISLQMINGQPFRLRRQIDNDDVHVRRVSGILGNQFLILEIISLFPVHVAYFKSHKILWPAYWDEKQQ